jgi:PDZ domain-containing protein
MRRDGGDRAMCQVLLLAAVVSLGCTAREHPSSQHPSTARPATQPNASRENVFELLHPSWVSTVRQLEPGTRSGTFRYVERASILKADFAKVEDANLGVDLKPGTYMVALGASFPDGATDHIEFHIDKKGALRYLSPKFLKLTQSSPPERSGSTATAERIGGCIGIAVLDWSAAVPETPQEDFAYVRPAILVTAILPDSPAIDAGLLPGDVIDRINGKAVEASADIHGQSETFIKQIRSLLPGTTVKLRVIREGGQPLEVEVKLANGH